MGLFTTRREAAVSADQSVLLASRLVALGFWDGLDSEATAVRCHAVERGVHPIATGPGPLVALPADGEELAEGGVEAFLRDGVAPLVARWVAVEAATRSGPDTHHYVVDVNGRSVTLHGTRDWARDGVHHPWHLATVRPLAVVNELLDDAGAPVRWHVLHAGGNDGLALLLRPQVVDALVDAGYDAPHDIPRPAV